MIRPMWEPHKSYMPNAYIKETKQSIFDPYLKGEVCRWCMNEISKIV